MSGQKPPRVVQSLAPAKLNLFLELLGRREDRFHELETIVIAINRFDRIQVSLAPHNRVDVACRWLPSLKSYARRSYSAEASLQLPASEDNLVTRLLNEFRSSYGIASGFDVTIEKSIPAGAGMGGASSDAAMALMAAAKLHGISKNDSKLMVMAGEMGSDIPFFFGASESDLARRMRSSAALATGKGEKIAPLLARGNMHFVVVHPPVGLSTAEVYAHCTLPNQATSSDDICRSLARGDVRGVSKHLFNRLDEPARRLNDWVERVLHAMQCVSLSACQMTGSGSACFGISHSARIAQRAARRLQSFGLGVAFTAKPVSLPCVCMAVGGKHRLPG